MANGFLAGDKNGTAVEILAREISSAILGLTGQAQANMLIDGAGNDRFAGVTALGALQVDGSAITQPVSDAGGSLTVDGTIAVSTSPAASRLTDSISAAQAVDAVMSGLTAIAPQYQAITASASGATTLVAGVTSKKITVLSWVLVANSSVNVKFQSHTTPTDLTGLMYLSANGGVAGGYSPIGHFQTNAGEALDINLSGAVAVGGYLVYVAV